MPRVTKLSVVLAAAEPERVITALSPLWSNVIALLSASVESLLPLKNRSCPFTNFCLLTLPCLSLKTCSVSLILNSAPSSRSIWINSSFGFPLLPVTLPVMCKIAFGFEVPIPTLPSAGLIITPRLPFVSLFLFVKTGFGDKPNPLGLKCLKKEPLIEPEGIGASNLTYSTLLPVVINTSSTFLTIELLNNRVEPSTTPFKSFLEPVIHSIKL